MLAAVLLLAACGGAAARAPGELRFANRAPVWVVDDRRDLPAPPREARFVKALHHFDGRWYKRVDRWMQLRPHERAANVNALDEVPDSTWFENRIGARDLSPEQVAVGPNVTGSPEAHRPWQILSSKVGGTAVGFTIRDARGVRYLLKFDARGVPELETATDVVAQRLLWAAGYNVPEDHVVHFRRGDLLLAPGAVVKDELGRERPMTASFVDRALARVEIGADGVIRGLASQFLPGKPVGGHAREGVRSDDRNDRVPHELRRELRGGYAIFAWIDHADIKEDNTVDSWVADPEDARVHYVVHYLVDFGKALGAMPYTDCVRDHGRPPGGVSAAVHSLVTLGVWQRLPHDCGTLDVRGVALGSGGFDPGSWLPNTRSYFPIFDRDRFDGFWGAKIVARFTEAHIRAAVEEGRYSDPRAVRLLTERLLERRAATLRYWFARVNPLDRLDVASRGEGLALCFDDLAIRHQVAAAGLTTYRLRAFDGGGRLLGAARRVRADIDGRTCVERVTWPPGGDRYTIIELTTERPGRPLPPTLVHLARDPASGQPRVIGLRRL